MPHTAAASTEYKLFDTVLGKGAYGTVVKAVNVETQEYYAVKCFRVTDAKVMHKPGMPMPCEANTCLLRAANTLGAHRCRETSSARFQRYGHCSKKNTRTLSVFTD